MQDNFIKEIYHETIRFCEKRGLIEKLQKSLSIPEDERFSNRSIDSDGLDVLDAIHCLVDEKRTLMLMEEIDRQVKNDDIVIDAGIGAGILSFIASIKARKVYGFEINSSVYQLAGEIKDHLFKSGIIKDNIDFIMGDARKVKLVNKADIVISENLYTGMFFEKQIEIVSSLKDFIKTDGCFIPSGMRSFFFFLETDFLLDKQNKKMYVVSETKLKYNVLSNENEYDYIDFSKISNFGVDFEKNIIINNNGNMNSLLICSDVLLPSGNKISRFDTLFMNNDILLRLDYPILVERGDMIKIKISYPYGSNPNNINISIKKL